MARNFPINSVDNAHGCLGESADVGVRDSIAANTTASNSNNLVFLRAGTREGPSNPSVPLPSYDRTDGRGRAGDTIHQRIIGTWLRLIREVFSFDFPVSNGPLHLVGCRRVRVFSFGDPLNEKRALMLRRKKRKRKKERKEERNSYQTWKDSKAESRANDARSEEYVCSLPAILLRIFLSALL